MWHKKSNKIIHFNYRRSPKWNKEINFSRVEAQNLSQSLWDYEQYIEAKSQFVGFNFVLKKKNLESTMWFKKKKRKS